MAAIKARNAHMARQADKGSDNPSDCMGRGVDEARLTSLFKAMRLCYPDEYPADLTPTMERFVTAASSKRGDDTSIERKLYELFQHPEAAPAGIRKAILDGGEISTDITVEALKEAGFSLVIIAALTESPSTMPKKVTDWATRIDGRLVPWQLYRGGREKTLATAHVVGTAARRARLLGKSFTPIYTPTRDLCEWIDAAGRYGEDNKFVRREVYCKCDLLILDEWGQEAPTPQSFETLSRILTTRADNMLPTIITTSISMKQCLGRYLSRVPEKEVDDLWHVIRASLTGWDTSGKADPQNSVIGF